MRRFRRKFRGLWLPVYGNGANQNEQDFVQGSAGTFGVPTNGAITWDAFPVTFDYTESAYLAQTAALGPSPSLQDITAGNEWRLRRIVGKHHIGYTCTAGTVEVPVMCPAVEVASGYIVCKTDEEGDPTTDFDEVNPLIQESAEDPWIWRRKWILSNPVTRPGSGGFAPPTDDIGRALFYQAIAWPYNTAGYGSVLDGPHVDAKTKRSILRQERLFCVIAARIWNPDLSQVHFNPSIPGLVTYNIEQRLFGALSTNRGNRRNASR